MVIALTFLSPARAAANTQISNQAREERNEGRMQIYDALKIAVDLLHDKSLMYRTEYKLQASRVKNEWVFWFVFLPQTPGLDVTVFVSDEGKTRVLPGM
jgi:hypothetical protein